MTGRACVSIHIVHVHIVSSSHSLCLLITFTLPTHHFHFAYSSLSLGLLITFTWPSHHFHLAFSSLSLGLLITSTLPTHHFHLAFSSLSLGLLITSTLPTHHFHLAFSSLSLASKHQTKFACHIGVHSAVAMPSGAYYPISALVRIAACRGFDGPAMLGLVMFAVQVKISMLNFLQSVISVMDPSDYSNTMDTRLAVSRIINWTMEPRNVDVRKVCSFGLPPPPSDVCATVPANSPSSCSLCLSVLCMRILRS